MQSSVHLDMIPGPAWGVLLLLWSLAHVSCMFPYSVSFRSPILPFMCKSDWIPGSPYRFHHLCFPSDEHKFSSVQLFSCVQLFATPWTAASQASLSIINTCSLLKRMSIKWWCHPTISNSVVPFSYCVQSVPESGSFAMSQLFSSGGQSAGVSASASVLPMNIQN